MAEVGVIGAGRIGTMIARHLAPAGHDVRISAAVMEAPRREHTTLAPAPNGRLWVTWEGKDRGRLYATRTNRAADPKGAIVAVKPPRGTAVIHRLGADGSRGPLDLFALVERSDGETAFWHQRLRPGLSVKVKRKGKTLRFTVRDAGDPVKGARVKIAGYAAHKTGKGGTVTVTVGGAHKRKVKVTKPGFTPARLKVKA